MRDFLLPLAAVGAVAVALAVLVLAHPMLARMAARNAIRRRSRVLLVTFGLLVGTMIVSSSLSIGDTLDYIFTGDVYDRLGAVDVLVEHEVNGQLFPFPGSYFFDLRNESDRQGIAYDGMAPALQKIMPVRNNLTGNQGITVLGLDDAYESGFGGLTDEAGGTVAFADLRADSVYVNERAAGELNAAPGNVLTLFWGNNVNEVKYVTVQAILRDRGTANFEHLAIVLAPLAASQSWFNATGR